MPALARSACTVGQCWLYMCMPYCRRTACSVNRCDPAAVLGPAANAAAANWKLLGGGAKGGANREDLARTGGFVRGERVAAGALNTNCRFSSLTSIVLPPLSSIWYRPRLASNDLTAASCPFKAGSFCMPLMIARRPTRYPGLWNIARERAAAFVRVASPNLWGENGTRAVRFSFHLIKWTLDTANSPRHYSQACPTCTHLRPTTHNH